MPNPVLPPLPWRGSGRPVVMVHGWSMDAGFWSNVADDLCRDVALSVPDLAGVGSRRDTPAAQCRVADQADALARMIESTAPGPVTLVGHSMGAMIALLVAIRHSHVLERLVIVSPPIAGTRSVYPDLRMLALPGVRMLSLAFMKISLVRRIAATRFSYRVPLPVHLLDAAGSTASDVIRSTALSLLATDLTEELASIQVPTLVLHGERDAVIMPTQPLTAKARIPGAELEVFPDVGHCPSIEVPDLFVSRLKAFVCAEGVGLAAERVAGAGMGRR